MFTNWNRKANKETRLNPLSIDDIDALTIATLHGMGTTPEQFRDNVKQDVTEDAMKQGEAIMRRNPKVQMPDSHFKLQGAQEQQMMDDLELQIPEFKFNEQQAKTAGGLREMERNQAVERARNAYKKTYKDHVMQAFDKHKAFMQSLGNQPMSAQEFMQHPKVPSFTDYYKQVQEGTAPGSEYADEHPFALTHPDEFTEQLNQSRENNPYGQFFADYDEMRHMTPFIPVITGEPMDLAMDTLLKFQSAAQRRIYNQIPFAEEVGSIDDVVAMRNIPVRRLESGGMPSFNMPVPLRGNRPGDPLQFERDIHAKGGATIPGFTPDYEIPDDPRKEIQGTFVYPLDVSSLAPERFTSSGNPDFLSTGYPDMNRGIGDTVTLGILEKPEWRAGQAHGRSQPEGYQPFGFDKDAFVRLDGGLGVSAVGPREEWSALARRLSPAFAEPKIGDEALHLYDYPTLYRTLSKLPVTTTASNRNPLTGYKPTNIDFLLDRMGGARVVTGEPMDLAIDALLKRDKIYDPNAENKGQEGVDWHPGEEGVDWDSAVSSSLHPSHDLTQRHPFDYDMHEYDHHAQKLLNLMRNRDVAHLQNNENPMTEDEQFDLMDAQQKLQASIPKNTHFPSIQNAVGYDKDGNKISTFGDGRPKFNEGSPRYQELIGDRPTVPIHTEGSFYGVPFNEKTGFTRSEPMALAIDALLKDLSPEAKRHKLEYDKKYESSPERVKYREELNRERRRRGIYGSGDHMDVSHTEGGKLTLESEHDNRARHFKDKGTLRPSD